MASELPDHLQTGLREMVASLTSRKLRFSLIGGIAAGFRSRPRFTRDIDFLLEIPQLVLPGLLQELQSRGFSLDMEKVIREWNKDHFTVLTFHGVPIDWLQPVLPLYQHVIDQAKQEELLNCKCPIAAAEGLILTKLLAFRLQDQFDIENLLAAGSGQIDLDYIRREWLTVATENDSRYLAFKAMVEKFHTEDSNFGPTAP